MRIQLDRGWAGLVGLMLTLGFLTACDGKNASPEAAFQKLQAASKAKDYGKYYDCMTLESQNYVAGEMVTAMEFASLDRKSGKDAKTILDKYKVTTAGKPPQGVPISDKRAFIVESMQCMDRAGVSKNLTRGLFEEMQDVELADVKIDGDKATGTIKASGMTHPVRFEKINDSWLIPMFSVH